MNDLFLVYLKMQKAKDLLNDRIQLVRIQYVGGQGRIQFSFHFPDNDFGSRS